MPTFHYVAVSATNERLKGTLVAEDETRAARTLLSQGLIILKVAPQTRLNRVWAFLNQDVTGRAILSDTEVSALLSQWGSLIEAGVPLSDALNITEAGTSNRKIKSSIAAIRKSVIEGASLHEALLKGDQAFPHGILALIKAAEESRLLGPTLSRLGGDLDAKRQFNAELRNALLYPAFIAVTAMASIIVLLTVVVPNIETLLEGTRQQTIPLMTSTVIGLSQFLRAQGLTLLFSLVCLSVALLVFARTQGGRVQFDRWLLRWPIVGRLLLLADTARLLRTLSELLTGGVSLARALPLAITTVRNTALRLRLAGAQSDLLQGASLTESLMKADCLSIDIIQVARVGERTGKLAELLGRAALACEQTSRLQLKALTTIVGPALTVIFGLMAGFIIYAVMTTILSLNELAFQ